MRLASRSYRSINFDAKIPRTAKSSIASHDGPTNITMSQPNHRISHDFIWGLFLVPLLHFAFTLLWLGIAALLTMVFPFFNQNYNVFLLFIPIATLSLTQSIYLIPAYIHFTRKHRHEVGKGILLGAIATLFLNGACFAQMGNFGNAGGTPQLLIAAIVMLITIGLIAYLLVTRRR
jgi:hypothetical protein